MKTWPSLGSIVSRGVFNDNTNEWESGALYMPELGEALLEIRAGGPGYYNRNASRCSIGGCWLAHQFSAFNDISRDSDVVQLLYDGETIN